MRGPQAGDGRKRVDLSEEEEQITLQLRERRFYRTVDFLTHTSKILMNFGPALFY